MIKSDKTKKEQQIQQLLPFIKDWEHFQPKSYSSQRQDPCHLQTKPPDVVVLGDL